jgi:hypothetical protein
VLGFAGMSEERAGAGRKTEASSGASPELEGQSESDGVPIETAGGSSATPPEAGLDDRPVHSPAGEPSKPVDGPATQRARPRLPEGSGWRTFLIALGAGLAVLILYPLVSGLPSIPAHVIHSVYALVSDTQEQEGLKSDINARPFWERAPTIYGRSLNTAINPGGGDVSETDGSGDLVYHSISALAANAPAFDGYPVEFVGRVESQSTLSTSVEAVVGVEYELTGSSPGSVAYVAVAGDATPAFEFSDGQIALIRGVVVASGIARQLNGASEDAVYVYGLDSELAAGHPGVKRLISAIEHNSH